MVFPVFGRKHSGFLSGFFRLGCQKCIQGSPKKQFLSRIFSLKTMCVYGFSWFWAKTFRLPGYIFSAWSWKTFSTCPRYRFEENEIVRKKKNSFQNYFWTLWEEISDLWQNFYRIVFKSVFDMPKFFAETVIGFW